MNEVHPESVDPGLELRETIEQRLAGAPVVVLQPVVADFAKPFARNALAPVVDQFGFRPAGVLQPRLQIIESSIVDSDAKRFGFCGHDAHDSRATRRRLIPPADQRLERNALRSTLLRSI